MTNSPNPFASALAGATLTSKPSRSWTPEQAAFIERVKSSTDSIRLDAVAGSGKTTTLEEASKGLDRGAKIILLAFNKSTAEEASKKFPPYVQCKTLNSVGNAVWTSAVGRKALDPRKMGAITSEWCQANLTKDEADLLWNPLKLVASTFKSKGLVPAQYLPSLAFHAPEADLSETEAILEANDLGDLESEFIHKAAIEILTQSINEAKTNRIDFDDQIYMATYFAPDRNIPNYNVVLVDEAQDLSSMQHDMIERLGASSRLIVSGDPHQAIYGWRGASCSSLDDLSERFGLVRMPLTVSFRCPEAVVCEAQPIVPHIKAAKSGGQVEDWTKVDSEGEPEFQWHVEDFALGSVVLCRNNAPLIKLGFAFIRFGIPCYFTGKDLAAGLTKIVKALPESEVLSETLRAWYTKERDRLEAKSQYALLDRLDDRYEALQAIMSGSKAMNKTALVRGIENLFKREPSPNAIELSTIHRAKGKEWQTVYFLNRYLIPGKWISEMVEAQVPGADDLLTQEYNLEYVAITRALQRLVYFNLDKKTQVQSRNQTQE